ncbi:DUF4242 domain-containing protein [Streptomyces sp. ISL-96]|uniref:DUF4242 domain-containing protein n=1 Tax=Streptomyces sp. ISL-96 TaxID=2819191 RepID=UPI001BECC103|nr:DUF4242 domain-containing protein [Streptomyces sp. ISL-96]MBT2493914.1 DUF4242 domain-containing protein [Streptomyces sp. ISL-96]
MPRYLVEHYFPYGIAEFLAEKPVRALIEANNGTEVVWLHSYITEGHRRVYCLYEAASPEAIRKAARRVFLWK